MKISNLFQLAVEAAPNGMVMVNEQGLIILINAQTEKMFGYSREELMNQPIEILVPERFRGNHPHHRAGFFKAPQIRAMGAGRELYGCRKDGSEFPVEIGLNPIKTDEGSFVLSAIVDITERKRAEEKIKSLVATLEGRVQERTAVLQQQRSAALNLMADAVEAKQLLQQSEAEIQAKNEELGTLLHVISHDLKEPLRSMETFSKWVGEQYQERLDEKGKDFLTRIQKGADRMRHLLDDLLALSRIKKIETPQTEVEGSDVVEKVLEGLAARIKEIGARITVGQGFPKLKIDPFWATQTLTNLVQNALKFVREGERPEIEICALDPETGGRAGFVVKDRGPGIGKNAERMFELFQRGVGREVEGTGAGLAIVRAIARQHGGDAWVRPREGGGSEFFVCFS